MKKATNISYPHDDMRRNRFKSLGALVPVLALLLSASFAEVSFAQDGTSANPVVFRGTNAKDEFEQGRLRGFRRFLGRGNPNDQVNYDGARSNYGFIPNGTNRYIVMKPNGDFDDLRSVEGVYFRGQQEFFFIRDIENSAANPIVFQGTRSRDEFEEGRLTGFRRFIGRGGANDQVNYDGSLSDYTFEANGTNRYTVTKPNGDFDDLRTVEGVYFRDEGAFYFIRDINDVDGTAANPIVFLGTRAKDEFEEGRLTGFRRFVGRGNANDQVNYDGNLSDYTFTANGTNRFIVTKPNGDFDDLRTVEGVYFREQQQFFFIRDIIEGTTNPSDLASNLDVFAFAGQSNVEGHFSNVDGNNNLPTGAMAFANRVQSLTGFSTETINVAVGGSHSNEIPDGANPLFWWDATNDQPGQILLEAVASIRAELDPGQDLDGLIWGQGESDAVSIYYSNAGFTETIRGEFADATLSIFQYFRDAFGADLPIYIQQLNDFDVPEGATFPGNDGFAIIRREQSLIINNQSETYLGARTRGLGQRDPLHFNTVSQNNIAEQLASAAVEVETAP